MIKERQDITFLILTKRIDRFMTVLPADWGEGYDNVNLVNPYKQNSMARECGIDELAGKKLF